jgi:hypothetical protein
MHYRAKVQTSPGIAPRDCVLLDVSEGGARLMLEKTGDLPEDFTLFLSERGAPRRQCHIAWRSPAEVGVNFNFARRPSQSA